MESMEGQGHSEVDAGNGRSARRRSPRLVPLVRWLLVLPAAIGVPALILVALDAIAQRWQALLVPPAWLTALTFVLLAVVCVIAAVLVAPARRRLVGLVAASAFTAAVLGVSVLMALSSNWSFRVSTSWAAVGIAIAIAAAYGTAHLVGGKRA